MAYEPERPTKGIIAKDFVYEPVLNYIYLKSVSWRELAPLALFTKLLAMRRLFIWSGKWLNIPLLVIFCSKLCITVSE